MSTAPPVQLSATYNRELLEMAAKCYVRRYFRGNGRWLLAACVINAIGFGAAVAFGAKRDFVLWWVSFIVAIGPLYCAYLFYAFPKRYASRATRLFAPTTRISFTESGLEFTTKDRAAPVPWTLIKAVWECPGAFLLVFFQLIHSFIVIPKNELPSEARAVLAAKVGGHEG